MPLLQKINQLSSLSNEALLWLEKHLEEFEFSKNQTILEQHAICNYLYYIKSGIMSGYYHTEEKEVCNWLACENDFATSYYSFISRKPSYEIIECYEDTQVQAISYQHLNKLYELFPETERLGRLILEEYYSRLEERIIGIQFRSAKERYSNFFQKRPQLMNRAPLGRIASYLGMTQETLSRIRAEK